MTSDASALRIPQVRARHMQTFIADVNRLPDEDRRAILAAISPGTLNLIASGTMLGWVPFSCDVECSRAVTVHLGSERAHLFLQRQIMDAVETSLLAGLTQSAMRLAGADPRLYLPFLGKGYDTLFRGCGRLAARHEPPNSAITELRGLPEEALEDRYWIDSVASSFCGLARIVGFDCTVNVGPFNHRDRSVTFVGSWRQRPTSRPPAPT